MSRPSKRRLASFKLPELTRSQLEDLRLKLHVRSRTFVIEVAVDLLAAIALWEGEKRLSRVLSRELAAALFRVRFNRRR